MTRDKPPAEKATGASRSGLSAEDRALWDKVKQSANPLRPRSGTVSVSPPPGANVVGRAPEPQMPASAQAPTGSKPPVSPAPLPVRPAPATLDRRTTKKIARGMTAIDGRIDLHGMTQRSAHARLLAFLDQARRGGSRVVLVITGKGVRTPDPAGAPRETGVLRRAVPLWLEEPAFRALVAGFSPAHRSHGGEGALYVRLRRRGGV